MYAVATVDTERCEVNVDGGDFPCFNDTKKLDQRAAQKQFLEVRLTVNLSYHSSFSQTNFAPKTLANRPRPHLICATAPPFTDGLRKK